MALDVVDADVLKRNIVHLLLKHPQGIKYGDFSGAFYKLHGHHPQLALHGYGSLKCLLTDMKNMVVLENNSETTVIKLANSIPFDPWLDEGDGWDNFDEGWDSSEEEIQSLRDDDEEDDEADPCGPAASLDTDFSACNLVPQKMGRKEAVLTAALVPILSILQDYPKGLNLPILTKALKKRGFDLEHFSQDMGYGDIIHCLLDVPGLHLILFNDMSAHNCVIQLLSSSSGLPALPLSTGSCLHKPLSSSATDSFPQQLIEAKPASRSSATSQATASLSCDLDCLAIKSKTLNQNELGKKPEGLTAPKEVLVSLSNLLNIYLMGLRVKKLQELLLSITGFDLEKFSIAQGYKDTLEFLEHQMPKLKIRYDENRQNSVVKQGKKKKRKKSQHFQEKMTKTPAEVLTLLPNLLSSYPEGLRVKKLQTFLLSVTGFDLEKFSIAQGYKDTLEFLEHQMPELKIRYDENRRNCVVMQGKKKKQKKSQDFQKKMTQSPAEVLALLTNLIKTHKTGLRVKKLQELLMAKEGFDLEKFSIALHYKDTLEFLEHRMPELTIRYHENRQKCVVKQDPDVKVPPPLPNGQPQVESTEMVEPPNATPALGGISKPCFRKVTKAGPGASRPLQNGLHSGIPVPFTIVPNHPSFKEQLGASSNEDSSSSQPHSDIPAQQSSVCQFGGPSAAREVSHPIDAQVPSKSSLTHSEHLDELKQQVAHILAKHPEGMSLFQFRATYSMTYQHHLPLGNASSAKQRLLEMSDIVSMKGCGVQTLLLPVSPEEPPPKPGPPVFSRVENGAMVLADSLPKAVVRPESVVVSKPSLLKTPIQPQPYATHPLASDHLRTRDVKENSVPPTELFSTIPTVVQKPVGPKVILRGHSDSSKTEAAKNLGNFLPEAVVKIEPVVIPESSSRPLSRTAAVPVPQLLSSVPSSSTCLRASSNKESSFLPESLPPQIPKPLVPVEKNVRFRIMPGENLLIPHSPVVFPADIDSFNPAFSVNVPVPSLFQPVLTNIITMSQPVVYPPLTHLPHTPALSQSVSRTLSTAQLQKTELVSSHLTQPASQGRTMKPTSPIQHAEQIDHTHTAEGIDALQSTSRTWGPGRGQAPGFSADGCPVSSPSVKPPSLQPLNSPSIQQPENVHHTWLSSMPCSSVPTADDSVVASSSARVPSKPVVPAHQKQYDVVDAPVTAPRTPLSSVSHQPASSSYRSHTESDTAPFNPLVSMPQPHHIRVDSAVASSNAHPSILHSSQGSPISTASQPSYVSFRPKTGYDASHHSKPLPGVSREGSGQDSHLLTLRDNQKYHFKEESRQPSALQNSPPPRRSDNCVIL